MKISEIITDKYKLRIPPAVFYELLADVQEAEEAQEPTTKNNSGVDCISRAEAVRVASGYCHPSNIAKELAKLPSVTPQEPKTGHWIEVIDEIDSFGNRTWHHECSICGNKNSGWREYKYCPNCGAKMTESEEEE